MCQMSRTELKLDMEESLGHQVVETDPHRKEVAAANLLIMVCLYLHVKNNHHIMM